MATTVVVQLISGLLMILSMICPSEAVTCYKCTYDPSLHTQLSSCHLPFGQQAAPTCDGHFCQTILFTSSQQSVSTVYRSCIDLPSNITAEECSKYSRVLGIAFFAIDNLCCYSIADTTGSYTHCFCQKDFCNHKVSHPLLDAHRRPHMTTTTTTAWHSLQLAALTQQPIRAEEQRQSVTCYNCNYSVNVGVVGESTCREPFNSTGISTCSAKGCYNYAYLAEEQYTVIRGCDAVGNFQFESEEQCLHYSQVYNETFFIHENQCCFTTSSRWNALTVCYCYSDLCNTNVSRPTLAVDALTTTSKPLTLNSSTYLATVGGRNNTAQADTSPPVFGSKRYTPPLSRQTTTEPTKRPTRATPLRPANSARKTTPTRGSMNNTRTTLAPAVASITCYSCSFFPTAESAADSVCSGPASVATCTGRACYFYASTSGQGISVIYRECDQKGSVQFQSAEQCLQYSKVYNLTFFTFEHQCCYITDAFGVPVTVCFCNTPLCNSNRFRPTPQTASTTPLTALTSNPIPDILPSLPQSTTIVTSMGSAVSSTGAATLSRPTSSVTPSGSEVNARSTAGPVSSSASLQMSSVTQLSSEMSSTETSISSVRPTETSPSSASLPSTQKTASLLSITTSTINHSVRCYNCTYFPNSDLTGTSMCTDNSASTNLATCTGRSCYTYTYMSQQGVLVIFRACDKEGTLEFQSDEQCLQYSQVHHLAFFTFEHQCCYTTDVSGRPITVCFCNNDLCNSNRSRPTKKR